MRIVQLNLAWDPTLDSPHALLDTYRTMTGWSDALASAGADVHVVQRFGAAHAVRRGGVDYVFVPDRSAALPPPWTRPLEAAHAVARAQPDLIHVNGLIFPGALAALRSFVGPTTAIVLQDHSGITPRLGPWPLAAVRGARWRAAFALADAVTLTARALVTRWRRFGLPGRLRVLEIPEASTLITPIERLEARRRTGLAGSPALLWVGRLNQNKDPTTVLEGLARALPALGTAHLTMIVPGGTPRDDVARRLARMPALRGRVTMLGPIPHHEMATYYSAADIFVSGSHHEGSGYALIEAMACGVVPCVTDIPAFAAIAGDCGTSWRPGRPDACAAALRRLAVSDLDAGRRAVLRRFAEVLTWPAIGRQTLAAYSALVDDARGGR